MAISISRGGPRATVFAQNDLEALLTSTGAAEAGRVWQYRNDNGDIIGGTLDATGAFPPWGHPCLHREVFVDELTREIARFLIKAVTITSLATYTVSVGGTVVTFVADADATEAEVVTGIIAALNDDPTIGADWTASNHATDTDTLVVVADDTTITGQVYMGNVGTSTPDAKMTWSPWGRGFGYQVFGDDDSTLDVATPGEWDVTLTDGDPDLWIYLTCLTGINHAEGFRWPDRVVWRGDMSESATPPTDAAVEIGVARHGKDAVSVRYRLWNTSGAADDWRSSMILSLDNGVTEVVTNKAGGDNAVAATDMVYGMTESYIRQSGAAIWPYYAGYRIDATQTNDTGIAHYITTAPTSTDAEYLDLGTAQDEACNVFMRFHRPAGVAGDVTARITSFFFTALAEVT